MKDIVLAAINSKWIHPSLSLRLLKANLGSLKESCEIMEFALRQPLAEKTEPLLAAFAGKSARPRILGISVSIWNHGAVVELLEELEKSWRKKPVIVLGGPEVSHLPPSAEIFRYADYVIRGEGEIAFRELCEKILAGELPSSTPQFIDAKNVDVGEIKSGYHLFSAEDIEKKLIYVESSRGCPFSCEFCLSSVKDSQSKGSSTGSNAVREFPLEPFLAEMDDLVRKGAKTFKFLDRTFNSNIKRTLVICEFFLEKIRERKEQGKDLVVHFEMVPSIFPSELREMLSRFPPGTLRMEIGIQTLNAETAARIGRPSNPEKELDTLSFLRENTSAIIHADLIAGLPGESLASFSEGFDRLWFALSADTARFRCNEIQLGILKLLPGAPISRHNKSFAMKYNPKPPYEIEENADLSAVDLQRIKNYARFWELTVNRGLLNLPGNKPVFEMFMTLSASLLSHFGRNWGIDKSKLTEAIALFTSQS